MKKIFHIIGIIILVLIISAALFLGVLTLAEYNPDPVSNVSVCCRNDVDIPTLSGDSFSVMTWNLGYGALGAGCDFTLDGGSGHNASNQDVINNVCNFENTVEAMDDVDFFMFQEIDRNSDRSFDIDQIDRLSRNSYSFANNYKCIFVPFPFPPLGTVDSGLMTTTDLKIDKAKRISLPCTFKWPVRIANLKRCMLVSYIPLEGSDKKLVLINVHLEAYDKGEAKAAQTEMLLNYIEEEYMAGNYVIVGGDFNSCFPGSENNYPLKITKDFVPSKLDDSMIPSGFKYGCDITVPSCRLLNQPYNPADVENTQYYVLDGYIVSPNLLIESVKTLDYGFESSDHNPVVIKVKFM